MAGSIKHHYFEWREETILVYPHIIILPAPAPINDIAAWFGSFEIDHQWNLSRFNVFDFQLAYDFFFRTRKDASVFKLAWGGRSESGETAQFSLFYL